NDRPEYCADVGLSIVRLLVRNSVGASAPPTRGLRTVAPWKLGRGFRPSYSGARGRGGDVIAYYLQLALRSLRRNRAITVLMIVIIGFGVAASMTTWSVFRAVSGDPIPQKSAQLF